MALFRDARGNLRYVADDYGSMVSDIFGGATEGVRAGLEENLFREKIIPFQEVADKFKIEQAKAIREELRKLRGAEPNVSKEVKEGLKKLEPKKGVKPGSTEDIQTKLSAFPDLPPETEKGVVQGFLAGAFDSEDRYRRLGIVQELMRQRGADDSLYGEAMLPYSLSPIEQFLTGNQ